MEHDHVYEWVKNSWRLLILLPTIISFSVNTASEYKEVCFPEYRWSFRSGLRYCFALTATIGYGDYYPQTDAGKIFTFFYMLIGKLVLQSELNWGSIKNEACFLGIPAFLLATVLSAMALRSILSQANLFYSLGLFLVLGFICLVVIPSFIASFIYSESKTVLDEIYFRCISLTTVGFGDIVPFNSPPERLASTDYDQNKASLRQFLIINITNTNDMKKIENHKSVFKAYSMGFSMITMVRSLLKLNLLAVNQFTPMQFISVLPFMKL